MPRAAIPAGIAARARTSPHHEFHRNEAAHHAERPDLDELKAMLLKAGVDYDPQYLL